jgi:cytochrome c-type biogenesis protein CcmF
VRLYYKPFVVWIWLGALIMSIGGVLSISDKRYRIKKIAKIKSAVRKQDDAGVSSTPDVALQNKISEANG